MCGRYGRRGDKQKIAEVFRIHGSLEELDIDQTFNAVPGSIQPVVMLSDAGEREISMMRWGFKLPDRLLFLARSDGAMTAKFWKDKFSARRCIVPASLYVESKDCETKPKPKFEITIPGRELFGMAGVWSPWQNPKTGEWEDKFSIFTTDPNDLIGTIHTRQPVIPEPDEYEEWLATGERPPSHLLRVVPAERMEMVPLPNVDPPKISKTRKTPKEPLMRSLFD